jgi:hypothetical protein
MGANADLVRGYIDAIAAGDVDAIASYLSDDVVFHISGRNMMSGDHTKDTWVTMFRQVLERSGGGMAVEVHDLLESEDHVVALVRRTMAGVDSRAAIVYHVAGGKITETWVFEGDQHAIDEAMRG